MSDLRSHGPSVNADVIDLAEERRRNALYVLGILLRAYVPKNTSDSRELDSALAALASPPIPAGQTLSAQPVASKELSDEQIDAVIESALAGKLDEQGRMKMTFTRWKDGIDVDYVTPKARAFARAILAASRLDGANAAHSKSEYKRRVAMGDTNIQPPGEKP